MDSEEGLNNCLKLSALENKLGFRSSFNFVPLANHTPDKLRHRLVESGFEVGIHKLTHEGISFKNYKAFSRIVPAINSYLKKWKAAGFTSPSMLCNLAWIADLNIEYSCSSFDTDPFEPRPFGVATSFPFQVNKPDDGRSYIELPYTLAQDHTLFILLRQKDISAWKRKLDWVAKKGGVALINTHPDYMDFDSDNDSYKTYPARRYAEFLEYIIDRYSGKYWHCLPISLARFWRASYPKDAFYDHYGSEIASGDRAAIYSTGIKYERKVKIALVSSSVSHFNNCKPCRL